MAAIHETSLQLRFLAKIKNIIHPTVSFADELAQILEISTDSAYRRIRGETALGIDEVNMLCNHYKIAFDVFAQDSPSVTFNYKSLNDTGGFSEYLESIRNDMIYINTSDNKLITYAATDLPIFHHFNYPVLAAFKMFYWIKAVLNAPIYQDKKFDASLVSESLAKVGKEIYQLYQTIPSIEIWSSETINSQIKQIEFYWDSGMFKTKDDALIVCNQFVEEIRTLEKQAELSSKIVNGSGTDNNKFTMYHSEIEIGSNYILVQKGDTKTVYLTIHTFNKMVTTNSQFGNETQHWIDNLVRKSTLISGVAEKHRYQFFKKAYDKLEKLNCKISEG